MRIFLAILTNIYIYLTIKIGGSLVKSTLSYSKIRLELQKQCVVFKQFIYVTIKKDWKSWSIMVKNHYSNTLLSFLFLQQNKSTKVSSRSTNQHKKILNTSPHKQIYLLRDKIVPF